MVDQAKRRGVWLRPFSEYQQVWDHSRYLRKQTADLLADTDYPLDLHVDKRWAPLGEDEPGDGTAASRILDWLETAEPRFVLVLGDFGTGKTYLLHALAQALAGRPDVVPVLLTMRDLEKGRTLDELLAQHMARHGRTRSTPRRSGTCCGRAGSCCFSTVSMSWRCAPATSGRAGTLPFRDPAAGRRGRGEGRRHQSSPALRHRHRDPQCPGHRGRPAAGLPHDSAVPARRRAATGTGGRSVRG